ncbi:MAG TPA: lamin tail domain-containing protein, partial [Tepidisphaeraceae bacterium]
TVIPANGYISFAQNGAGGFGSAFQLSALGSDVYLTSNDGSGGLGGYRDHVDFGASEANVSFGRYVKSTGATDFVAQSAATRDGDNAYPEVGPVVINEIMYNPQATSGGPEYVELRNITDAPVSLSGWRFTDGITFTFSFVAADMIGANGYALVVPIDPATFRATYNVPVGVAIFGPYTGQLNNGGEKLTLSKPGVAVGQVTPNITVDRVNYDNEAPWPALPLGTGPSDARINAAAYGNDPINWRLETASGSAGLANGNAPLVFNGAFGFASLPRITVKFSKDVGASLGNASLTILNQTTGQTLDPSRVTRTYDAATQTATWQFPADLADGNYRATVNASAVSDAQGRPLDGNGDGTGGDDYAIDFYWLGGDANRDRHVDFNDLVALAQNYNATGGKGYDQGDFNFDGSVNFQDLVILAQHYNGSLPAAGAPVAASPIDAAAVAASMGLSGAPAKAPNPKPGGTVKVVTKPAPVQKPAPPRPMAVVVGAPKPPAALGTKKRITQRVFD